MQEFRCFFFFRSSHLFPWIDKFLYTESSILPCFIKKENYSSPYYIFQSVFALNMHRIKTYRRSVEVLITLLIKE